MTDADQRWADPARASTTSTTRDGKRHGFRAVEAEIMDDGIPPTGQRTRDVVRALMDECEHCTRLRRIHSDYRRKGYR